MVRAETLLQVSGNMHDKSPQPEKLAKSKTSDRPRNLARCTGTGVLCVMDHIAKGPKLSNWGTE